MSLIMFYLSMVDYLMSSLLLSTNGVPKVILSKLLLALCGSFPVVFYDNHEDIAGSKFKV